MVVLAGLSRPDLDERGPAPDEGAEVRAVR